MRLPSATRRHRQSVDLNPFDAPRGIDATPERTFTVAMVTGHRPQHLSAAEMAWSQVALHAAAWRLRSRYGMLEGVSGMAIGADTWWSLSVLAAGAHLAAYIPFEEQARRWSETERAMWTELRRRAHREVLVAAPGTPEAPALFHARNDAMLKETASRDGLVVALCKPDATGGTASTLAKARKADRPVLLLDPVAQTVTRERW